MSDRQLSALQSIFTPRRVILSVAFSVALATSILLYLRKRSPRLTFVTDGLSALLGKEEASIRAAAVSGVHYEVKLNLLDSLYKGYCRCRFYTKTMSPLRLDFAGKRITDFRVNHQIVVPNWQQGIVTLPQLPIGHQEVEIRFENDYAENGLTKYVEDGDTIVLLLSTSGNRKLHHVIPCFDQPDLKATAKLLLTVPQDWQALCMDFPQIVTSYIGYCPDPDPIYDTEQTSPSAFYEFYHTPKCSPEHFSICAGVFNQFNFQTDMRLAVYCRPKLAHKVNLTLIFDLLQRALEYMKSACGVPYGFAKLDIIFLPSSRLSAHAASLIYLSESLLVEDWSDQQARKLLENALVEEIAAQWMGVLVTYRNELDAPAWSEATQTLREGFFNPVIIPTPSLKRVFSLHKWSNCAKDNLSPD